LDENDGDSKRLHELLNADRRAITVSTRKKNDFDSRNIEQDLARLLGDRKFDATSSHRLVLAIYLVLTGLFVLDLFDLKHAMSATSCLISGLELMSKEENFGAYGILKFDSLAYMRLDNAAVQALNLLPTSRDRTFDDNNFSVEL